MPPVFGRYLPDPHPYDAALAQMRAAGEGEAAVAVNLMHDHRVSPGRESAFDTMVAAPCSADDLKLALVHYQKTRVQTRRLPHYVYDRLNGDNLLNGRVGVPPLVKPDLALVRVLDLNGLRRVFQWGQTEGATKYPGQWGRTFERFPTTGGDDLALMDFLDEKMGGRSVEGFVRAVLDLLDVYGRVEKKPFQPTWATTWAAFRKHAAEGPDRWHQVLGMEKPGPCWLLLLKYTVKDAGTVARPTQLDAGWYASHFPSPPQTPRNEGGHPMDLSTSLPADDNLLPEYVHKQIHHPLSHWTTLAPSFQNYGRTTAPHLPSLSDQRHAHHRRLGGRYGAGVRGWMSSPM